MLRAPREAQRIIIIAIHGFPRPIFRMASCAHDDAAIAREVITLLHDVYGYYGATKLEIVTEESPKT